MNTKRLRLVSRELHPEKQYQPDGLTVMNRIVGHTYTSNDGVDMIEARRTAEANQYWLSGDNGRTWVLKEETPAREPAGGDLYTKKDMGAVYLDPDSGSLVRFLSEMQVGAVYFNPEKPRTEKMASIVPDSQRNFYQVSRDRGLSWGEKRPLQEERAKQGNTPHSYYSAFFLSPPPYLKFADGTILIPYQVDEPHDETGRRRIGAGCFRARWTGDGSHLMWESGGKVPGGGCEQTMAMLRNERVLCILRAQGVVEPYFFSPHLRPYTISEDKGKTWSRPNPLTYTDGSLFTSPAAWSQLIRSSKNGKLYWIANILPAPDNPDDLSMKPPRCDPRNILQIAEVAEDPIGVVKDTVTIIEQKEPDDPELVRFSNFPVYEDRETGEIVVLMIKSYQEYVENLRDLPFPNYRYRISVPD